MSAVAAQRNKLKTLNNDSFELIWIVDDEHGQNVLFIRIHSLEMEFLFNHF